MINNKGDRLDHQRSRYPTLFTKVRASFPKISVMTHYQGVTQKFG